MTTALTSEEESRIYGGSNAKTDKHMYMAGLYSYGLESDLFCGGTLIAPQYVLTAGHCLDRPIIDMVVSIGSEHSSGRSSQMSELKKAVEAFRLPQYRMGTDYTPLTHDVALLKLDTPSKIQPARLPFVDGSDNEPGVMATALGWGLCAKLYAEAGEQFLFDDSMICAGKVKGKDICSGDSGGPLLVGDVVVGIVSFGPEECGVLPGIYARVSVVLEFINDIQNGASTGNVTALLTVPNFLFNTTESHDGSTD
ncbi:Trypsin [Phytophthora infestans]|uniref:Trypsin n=1 Tax=Phytophthora infestans TaxID=4787 RepID=A0A833WLA4_PHYIN|nr:Trypsin [Phytophthora infestans]